MFDKDVAVIIAGGKSSRMLQDKSLLPFGDCDSLAQFQYERLIKLFSKVYISSKSDKFDFTVDIIKDVEETSSPLVALVSIFETLEVDEVFVLSVDAPFVDEVIIKKLYGVKDHSVDVIVAESKNGMEPLCAIYRRSFLSKAKKALEDNQHRLQRLLNDLRVIKVYVNEGHKFMNLNYPHDYDEALKYSNKQG